MSKEQFTVNPDHLLAPLANKLVKNNVHPLEVSDCVRKLSETLKLGEHKPVFIDPRNMRQ